MILDKDDTRRELTRYSTNTTDDADCEPQLLALMFGVNEYIFDIARLARSWS